MNTHQLKNELNDLFFECEENLTSFTNSDSATISREEFSAVIKLLVGISRDACDKIVGFLEDI